MTILAVIVAFGTQVWGRTSELCVKGHDDSPRTSILMTIFQYESINERKFLGEHLPLVMGILFRKLNHDNCSYHLGIWYTVPGMIPGTVYQMSR